jgi:hypothetical protein
VPSGIWHESEYDKLPLYDGDTSAQLEVGAFGAFYCHRDDGRLCAGWVGCHDMYESLALRFALRNLTQEDIDVVMTYECPVELFASGAEAAAHGRAEIEVPGERARRTIARLVRKQEAARRWWREQIGLGVQRCPLPSLEQVLFNSDWDVASPRHRPASAPCR